jgi:hypothetical protein
MPFSTEKLYEFHVANVRAIESALEQVARACRRAIGRQDNTQANAFTRTYALLLGAWAECRLRKVLYEPGAFSEDERVGIRSKDTQFDRWTQVTDLAFRKRQGIESNSTFLAPPLIPYSAFAKFNALNGLLQKDLRPVIELRNKLAHGQWEYPLTSDEFGISQDQMNALRKENLLSLQLKKRLITRLADAIHDLAVSGPTFDRDFDNHYRSIEQVRIILATRPYEGYVSQLRRSRAGYEQTL